MRGVLGGGTDAQAWEEEWEEEWKEEWEDVAAGRAPTRPSRFVGARITYITSIPCRALYDTEHDRST